MSKLACAVAFAACLLSPSVVRAYIEAPYSLGKFVQDSQQIALLEVTRVNKEKGLVLFKKLADLKGKSTETEFKHNIGTRGFHEREWKGVLAWAEVGKRALFFRDGDASETCISGYWYQCYREGEWWGMSHGEPYLLRTFFGEPEHLAGLIAQLLKGEEVVVPCLANANREQLQLRKGKLQRLRASLKKLDYNAKRDFAGWGTDGAVDEHNSETILKEGVAGWYYRVAAGQKGDDWIKPGFVPQNWKPGKAPLGYGEEEIAKRKGTTIAAKGQDMLFRLEVNVPPEVLARKEATYVLNLASDNSALVYWNGELIDDDSDEDHEFAYWNREIELKRSLLKAGSNTLAVRVKNTSGSSDLYLDAELVAEWVIPAAKPAAVAINLPKGISPAEGNKPSKSDPAPAEEERPDPQALRVDSAAGTVSLACQIAPRKLPHLEEMYPIEVVATRPHPRGQKAHETVVTFQGFKPSDLHAALVSLGLKPGAPALGEKSTPRGPVVKVWLEFTLDGKANKLPLEKCLQPRDDDGRSVPELTWFFTGSALKQPDPEKEEQVYGADLTGTLLSLFPVTDACVLQTQLTIQDESQLKLETKPDVLPPPRTKVQLVISVK